MNTFDVSSKLTVLALYVSISCYDGVPSQAREHFCQLIQYIRNKMRSDENDHISLFVGTWNMGDAGPPTDIRSWIRCSGIGKTLSTKLEHAHDMYVFGTQVSIYIQLSYAFSFVVRLLYV